MLSSHSSGRDLTEPPILRTKVAMIRAVVLCSDSVSALAHTLSDLVPGALEGVIRRVVVAAPADATDTLFELSDDAGASFQRLDGPFGTRAAAACAVGDWLMVMEAGTCLPFNWHAAAGDHLRRNPDQAAAILGDRPGLLAGRPLLALLMPRGTYAKAHGFIAADANLVPLLKRLERSGTVARI